MTYLIDIKRKDWCADAGRTVFFGLAVAHKGNTTVPPFDGADRLAMQNGIAREDLWEFWKDHWFSWVEYPGLVFHLFNKADKTYLDVTFETGAEFYRWFLSHRDPDGVTGPKSYWPCEGGGCPACLNLSSPPSTVDPLPAVL